MRKLCEEFKHFRGQPIEVIADGIRFCGIDIDSDEEAVKIIDDDGRLVVIEYRHIDAIIEPQMRLHRLCTRNDCECDRDFDDFDFNGRNGRKHRCDEDDD